MRKKIRTAEPAAHARIVMHVDETMLVEGHGYRPVMVVEGEEGYRQNGDWPYEGKKGQKMPWFLGPTIEDAKRQCRERNALAGIDEHEAFIIVARSIARGGRR